MTAQPGQTLPVENRAAPPLGWRAAVWIVSAAWAILQIPYGFGLQPYLFFDSGWALTTDALISEGLVPTRDFAYFYGLLVLAVDRGWFALFGATPWAQAALSLVCAAASTHAVIRFAGSLRLGRRGRGLLLAAAPLAIMPSFFPTPAHALEHALLINAIAFQAGGRNAIALALATVCLFVKPTLTAIYGPILVGIILWGHRPAPVPWFARIRVLIPAAAVGIALAGALAARFGWDALGATLIPLDGMHLYAAKNYGFFFGTGRYFWRPDPLVWWYYPFMPVGFWLVGTAVLAIGSVRIALRGPIAAVLLTCTALHFAFVFFLFGNDMSWKYYPYVLVFGLCGVVDDAWQDVEPQRGHRGLTAALIVLAILGQSRFAVVCLVMMANAVFSSAPTHSAATAGLLASPQDQESWQRVRAIAARQRVLLLTSVGAGHILMPEIDSPRSWFLLHPIARPAEMTRLRQQIQAAEWLVIPTGPGERLDWPEFQEELGCFRIAEVHSTFVLAARFKSR